VPVFETEHLAAELINRPGPAQQAILDRFGPTLANPDGTISHGALSVIVAKNPIARRDLETILFNHTVKALKHRIDAVADQPVVAVIVSMLHEGGWKRQFAESWCVYCEETDLIERAHVDGFTPDHVRAMMATQLSQDQKVELCNYVIDNSFSREETRQMVENTYGEALKRALSGPSEDTDGDTTVDPVDGTDDQSHDNCDESDRLKKWLDSFGKLGIEEVLSRLGDIAHVGSRTAATTATMRIDATGTDESPMARELEVKVEMSVRNKKGSSDLPPKQPPVPPAPPAPPVPPTQPPVPPGNGGEKGKRKSRSLVSMVAIVAIVVLTVAGLYSLLRDPVVNIVNQTINQVSVVINNGPATVPGNPPVITDGTCKAGRTVSFSSPPGKSFHFMPNASRRQVSIWEASFSSDCRSVTLRGLDSSRRQIIWQLFNDAYFTNLSYQYITDYRITGSIAVDRYDGPSNTFAGRTVYSSYRGSRASVVERVDSSQRPIFRAEWTSSTTLCVTEYDLSSGRVVRTYNLNGSAAQSYLSGGTYLYSLFNQ
jgi:dephospho-CoA kinase